MDAFISSGLDYCYGLFTDLPKKSLRLKLIQNYTIAQLLTRTKRREHTGPLLAALHWLPEIFRIEFQGLHLTYKALNGLGPSNT